jgi:hypothetical protein
LILFPDPDIHPMSQYGNGKIAGWIIEKEKPE